MRNDRFIASALLFMLIIQPGAYAQDPEKAVESRAAGQDTAGDRVSDWFATFGKSKEERMKILQERKSKRQALREERRTRIQEAETKEERQQIREEYKAKDKETKQEFKAQRQEMKQNIEQEKQQWREERQQIEGDQEKEPWGPDRRSLKYKGKGAGAGKK